MTKNHPHINSRPPKGVIGPMIEVHDPNMDFIANKYKEPEKQITPAKKI